MQDQNIEACQARLVAVAKVLEEMRAAIWKARTTLKIVKRDMAWSLARLKGRAFVETSGPLDHHTPEQRIGQAGVRYPHKCPENSLASGSQPRVSRSRK